MGPPGVSRGKLWRRQKGPDKSPGTWGVVTHSEKDDRKSRNSVGSPVATIASKACSKAHSGERGGNILKELESHMWSLSVRRGGASVRVLASADRKVHSEQGQGTNDTNGLQALGNRQGQDLSQEENSGTRAVRMVSHQDGEDGHPPGDALKGPSHS